MLQAICNSYYELCTYIHLMYMCYIIIFTMNKLTCKCMNIYECVVWGEWTAAYAGLTLREGGTIRNIWYNIIIHL